MMPPSGFYPPLGGTAMALATVTALVTRTRPLRPVTMANSLGRRCAISVVIAARDEADKLGSLLTDLAAQRAAAPDERQMRETNHAAGPPADVELVVETIVVDDESRDDTAAVAAGHGVQVISSHPRPVGWNPKVWALWLGSAHAHHPELVFLDADVRLAPGALAAIVAARRRTGGLLSVAPHHLARGMIEALSAPGNVVAVAGGGPGLGRSAAGAIGSCLAMSRADYRDVGGHGVRPATIVDDLDLAASARRSGLPVELRRGGGLVTMRSYPQGFGSLVAGWSKNLAAGMSRTPKLRSLAIGLWIASLVLPLALLAKRDWWLGGVLWAVLALHTHWIARRVGSFAPLATTLGAPLLGVFITGLTLRSVLAALSGRRIGWKGRALGFDGLEAPPPPASTSSLDRSGR